MAKYLKNITAFACALTAYNNYKEPVKACGIVGYVGKDSAKPFLLEGLTILQNRGYDSVGIATISPKDNIITTKFASIESTSDSIEILKANSNHHSGHKVGIGHTRWATHGGKTDENAHPHNDVHNRVTVVHNGTIDNYKELKNELVKDGIIFRSTTDTEVIAQMIGLYLHNGIPLIEAVKKTLGRLEGTWGLAILCKDYPEQIIACRNGSPICIGFGDNEMFIASETAAFSRYTRDYISLKDKEICLIKAGGSDIDISRLQKTESEHVELSPAPYPHWTIKEILEQPKALERTLNHGGRIMSNNHVKLGGLDSKRESLLTVKNIIITGCGTSYYAGLYGSLMMKYLRCFNTVEVVDASEFNRDNLAHENGGVLALSQSGETKDVYKALVISEELGVPRFSIVNTVGSLIARSTDCGIYLNAGRENAVASTKAFTSQVAALALISLWFAQLRETQPERCGHLLEAVHRLPNYTNIVLQQSRVKCREIAEKLNKSQHCFVLGKGWAEAIAREGALKIKELTYLHAEGYPGGALKHGPFALINETEHTPIIMIIPDDQHAKLMVTAAEEVRARGAYTIIITDNPSLVSHVADEIVEIPANGPLTALLAIIPIQIIAYELALIRGINPDKPRHLAKAVTVD